MTYAGYGIIFNSIIKFKKKDIFKIQDCYQIRKTKMTINYQPKKKNKVQFTQSK